MNYLSRWVDYTDIITMLEGRAQGRSRNGKRQSSVQTL